MNFDFSISTPTPLFAAVEGAWTKKRWWDWHGIATATEPIVAISVLRVENRFEWARSEKKQSKNLKVRLLLGAYDSLGKDVQVNFSMGGSGPIWRTILDDPEQVPQMSSRRETPIGRPFLFCSAFGTPKIELWGLFILREQVIGARKGLWHIKDAYRESLPPEWRKILIYGRKGALVE